MSILVLGLLNLLVLAIVLGLLVYLGDQFTPVPFPRVIRAVAVVIFVFCLLSLLVTGSPGFMGFALFH